MLYVESVGYINYNGRNDHLVYSKLQSTLSLLVLYPCKCFGGINSTQYVHNQFENNQ